MRAFIFYPCMTLCFYFILRNRFGKVIQLYSFCDPTVYLFHNISLSCSGEFQGPALLVILEGAILSREEVSNLQFRPPWRLRGNTLSYGLGLLSCYSVCDLLSMVSGDYFYIFDPHGSTFSVPPSRSPAAKVFSLTGILFVHLFFYSFFLSCCIYSFLLINANASVCFHFGISILSLGILLSLT